MKKHSKSKRLIPAKRKGSVRDISSDGQVEFKKGRFYIYEPLASQVWKYCRRHKITVQQFGGQVIDETLKCKGQKVETQSEKPTEDIL